MATPPCRLNGNIPAMRVAFGLLTPCHSPHDLHGSRRAWFIALSRSADRSEDDATAKDGSHVYGMTAMEAFLTIEFWLMVAIGFLVVGCGLMVINNIGEQAAREPASRRVLHRVCCMGRLCCLL